MQFNVKLADVQIAEKTSEFAIRMKTVDGADLTVIFPESDGVGLVETLVSALSDLNRLKTRDDSRFVLPTIGYEVGPLPNSTAVVVTFELSQNTQMSFALPQQAAMGLQEALAVGLKVNIPQSGGRQQ